jgi:hypothetical protein
MQPDHPVTKTFAGFRVFDMPLPRVEQHSGVKEKEDDNGNKS